eukprot:7688826-Prorocentrum_lima.AAC.1
MQLKPGEALLAYADDTSVSHAEFSSTHITFGAIEMIGWAVGMELSIGKSTLISLPSQLKMAW